MLNHRYPRLVLSLILTFVVSIPRDRAATAESFVNFESPQAHSITISEDGEQLLAVNTPNNSLSIYSIKNGATPKLTSEVTVGIEPVSIAVRSKNEVWVVNHISDSISVVDLTRAVVTDTIQTGDRPGDIVFAGSPLRAFVTSMTERCVYVIDAESRRQLKTIPIAGNDPRTLLASTDGSKVWVAIYRSGNKTTVVPHHIAPSPPKPTNTALPPAPDQGIIVEADDPIWKSKLDVELSDNDVFEIDVSKLKVARSFQSVGTILFNLAEHPKSGEIWVTNTEARNLIRFEPVLQGHVVYNQIAVVSNTGTEPDKNQVQQHDLNPEFDYDRNPNENALTLALAQPTDVVFSPDGDKAFVTSFGTDRIGILNEFGHVISRIEVGSATGSKTNPRKKRGPRAMVVTPNGRFLYVLNRLSNSVSTISIESEEVLGEVSMTDPTPAEIREGRGFLFDAMLSGNGTVSCASCHVDGDRDGLAWDLGDPGGQMFNNGSANPLHPMKGPLMTQTLKGLAGERIFHWRADRPGLSTFNGAFRFLMGGSELADDDMATFEQYMLNISFGPNPLSSANDLVESGKKVFETRLGIGKEGKNAFRCIDCHSRANGAGTTGFTGLIGQPTKVAQLRGLNERSVFTSPKERVNGFGFGADGSKTDLQEFLSDSHRFGQISNKDKQALEAFLLAFPTEIHGIIGQSVTVHSQNREADGVTEILATLLASAKRGECHLHVTGVISEETLQLQFDPETESFQAKESLFPPAGLTELIKMIESDERAVLTFMALPRG